MKKKCPKESAYIAYSKLESVLHDLAQKEFLPHDTVADDLKWIAWRKQYLIEKKTVIFLERASREIEQFVSELECSIKH